MFDPCEIPPNVDPDDAFRVEVTVESFCTIIDGRKEYTKGKTWHFVVDRDLFSIIELTSHVKEHFNWGNDQRMTAWYATEVDGIIPLIAECEIPALFERNADTRNVKFFVTIENKNLQPQQQPAPLDVVPPITQELVDGVPQSTQELVAVDPKSTQALVADVCPGLVAIGDGSPNDDDESEGVPLAAPFAVWPQQTYQGEYEDDEGVGHDEPKEPKKKAATEEQAAATEGQAAALQGQAAALVGKDVENNYDPQYVPGDDETILSNIAPVYVHNRDDPTFEVGATFPDYKAFKLALRQHAIKRDFEFETEYSEPERFTASCADPDCEWRIHASKLKGSKIFMVKKLPRAHTCGSVNKKPGKMANKAWIADRVKEILIDEPTLGAKVLQQRLEKKFSIKLSYNNVWKGKSRALEELHGTWQENFQMLWNFKAEIEATNPGSVVEIETKKSGDKVFFNRMFVAFKPCIDGFLEGCRPYLGIDSTFLTGRYTGQFAAAIAVDGHSWMFPVAFAMFDKETKPNWEWFMKQLHRCIGEPVGLAIHTDACKGLESAIGKVFKNSEHRECMRHLMQNFTKRYRGDLVNNMWPASWTYELEKHEALMGEIAQACPAAMEYLRKEHSRLWTRSKFSELCKVDYVNNNLAECFNSWIKKIKQLPVVDMWDTLREMVMEKLSTRREVAENLPPKKILPSVEKELNLKSKALPYSIKKGDFTCAEVSGADHRTGIWRHTVDLANRKCSCNKWQITGKPCTHALAFIFSLRNVKVEDYVDDYYSVQKFKAAYQGVLRPIRGKAQWPKVDLGFNVLPPKLSRSAGRPRNERIKSSSEVSIGKKHQCKRCMQFGHHEQRCREAMADADGTPNPPPKQGTRKRKKTTVTIISNKKQLVSPSTPTRESNQKEGNGAAVSSPMTRARAAALASSPVQCTQLIGASTSPGPLTRRQKAAMSSPLKSNM